MIEDNPGDILLVKEYLKDLPSEEISLDVEESLGQGEKKLKENPYDALLLDLNLPDSFELDTFLQVHKDFPKIPTIVFTSINAEDIGVKAVQEGAQDYLVKGRVSGALLGRSIRYAIERKKIAEALATEKEQLAVTLRSIGDGVIATDINGKVTVLNKVAENLTGWPQKDSLGRDLNQILQIVEEKSRKPITSLMDRVLHKGTNISRSDFLLLISKTKTESFISLKAAPIRDDNESIIGGVISFRDITAQKKMEGALFNTGQLELIGDIVNAHVKVELPGEVWITDASKAFPSVKFEIQTLAPISISGESGTIINNALVRIASVEWPKILPIIEKHPSVINATKWEETDVDILLNVKSKDAFILRSLIQSECILKYPILVQNGSSTWELISPRKKIDALLELFDEMGIVYTIASIGAMKKEEDSVALTKRQELVLEKAMALGYYELPRRITLTELAEKLNIAKSTLSGILRRISKKLISQE